MIEDYIRDEKFQAPAEFYSFVLLSLKQIHAIHYIEEYYMSDICFQQTFNLMSSSLYDPNHYDGERTDDRIENG